MRTAHRGVFDDRDGRAGVAYGHFAQRARLHQVGIHPVDELFPPDQARDAQEDAH